MKKMAIQTIETKEGQRLLVTSSLPDYRVGDNEFAVILQPDEWEMDEETLFSERRIWKKVNPHIGITVQADYYEREVEQSRRDPEKKVEVVTKLFNKFATGRVHQWIRPEQIAALQVDMRIEDMTHEAGWVVFVGMDFSLGDDLHAQTYLCRNLAKPEFFADLDAWISEDALCSSSIRKVYEQWIEAGWLRLSPGKVLEPSLPVDRIVELSEKVLFLRFGYDPYKALQPINLLKSWIWGNGHDPKGYVLPVRQNFATFNPAVMEIDYLIKANPPMIHFSRSPLWPWEFGNCVLAESNDGMENRKPVKANPGSDSCKVDNVQCLCSAMLLHDQLDGSEITRG